MKTVQFSTLNRPDSWDVESGGTIMFASAHDAKQAEALFLGLTEEINRLRGLLPEARVPADFLHAAREAEAKLRYMGRQFSSTNFTDRYGDGPVMIALADNLKKQIRACEPQPSSER